MAILLSFIALNSPEFHFLGSNKGQGNNGVTFPRPKSTRAAETLNLVGPMLLSEQSPSRPPLTPKWSIGMIQKNSLLELRFDRLTRRLCRHGQRYREGLFTHFGAAKSTISGSTIEFEVQCGPPVGQLPTFRGRALTDRSRKVESNCLGRGFRIAKRPPKCGNHSWGRYREGRAYSANFH